MRTVMAKWIVPVCAFFLCVDRLAMPAHDASNAMNGQLGTRMEVLL
jgi:hypothetical protein